MKKTRIIAMLMALIMVLALAACGKQPAAETTTTTEATEAPTEGAATGFPTQPVKIIVQYGAGGGVDVTARLVAKYAEKYLGQSIVVENVTGGSGVVGLTTLAGSEPDGYTLGLIFANTAIEGLITEGVTYTLDSYDPICQINFDPAFLVTKAGGEYDIPLDDVVAKTKESPLNMGIGALWQAFDFVKLLLDQEYDAQFNRVAYDGGAAVTASVASGDVELGMQFPNEWVSYYKTGELKGIAVASSERLEAFPDVPTFMELGYDKITDVGVRRVLCAPAGTDPAVMAVLEDAFLQALADPELIAEFGELGMSVVPDSAVNAKAALEADASVLESLINNAGIKPGDAPK